MRTLLFVFSAFFFLSTAHAELPYKDVDFGCISDTDANRFVSDFDIDVDSFGGLELCNPAKDTKKLFNDLSLIAQSQFEARGDHNFIRGYVDRTNYYSWMKGETRGVRRGHDIPYATAYNSGGYFTMQDGWSALSTLGRVGTIIHEARHTEGYRHYACTTGPYAGAYTAGCDTNYNQGGSHAVEMEYYARVVLESKNLHPVYQSMARLMALGRSNFVFNQQPMQKREALAALSDRKILLIDGNNEIVVEAPAAEAGARLKRTSFGASLVKDLKSVAVDLYGTSALNTTLSDDYSYYKLFKIPRDSLPSMPIDLEEVDVGNKRFFTALSNEGSVSSYNFPQGEWFSPSAPLSGATSFKVMAPNGQVGLFALTRNNDLVPFDFVSRSFKAPLAQKWDSNIASYAMMGSRLVKLTTNGQVLDASTNQAIEPFSRMTVTDLVNVPLYDAFTINR